MTTPTPPNDRTTRFVARRLDALEALVRHHPYSDASTLLSLAEHDADLAGCTGKRLGDMLLELLAAGRVTRGGSHRLALWFTPDAAKVVARRQAEKDASGELDTVTVPTPPVPSSASAPIGSMDGRQLARLAAPVVKLDDGPVVDPTSITGRMVSAIVATPGITARQAAEACSVATDGVSTLLAGHIRRGRLPKIERRHGDDGIWRYFPVTAPVVDEAPVEQLDDQAAEADLETAPGSSGMVAPRGVVGVDPSEGARVASDATPASDGDDDPLVLDEHGWLMYGGELGICDHCGAADVRIDGTLDHVIDGAAAKCGACGRLGVIVRALGEAWVEWDRDDNESTDESGVGAPEVPVEHVDGAGPSEVDPTASEAPPVDRCRPGVMAVPFPDDGPHLVADLTRRVMELEAECDALRGHQTTLERVVATLQGEIRNARGLLSKLAHVGADTPIDTVARRVVAYVDEREDSIDGRCNLWQSELEQHVAFIDTARVRVLRLLGSEADVEDQNATLDELLTSLEARVHDLEASNTSSPDHSTADRAELWRLANFLTRENRQLREGETPVDTAMRFILDDQHRLRMVAHLAVGGEVSGG